MGAKVAVSGEVALFVDEGGAPSAALRPAALRCQPPPPRYLTTEPASSHCLSVRMYGRQAVFPYIHLRFHHHRLLS